MTRLKQMAGIDYPTPRFIFVPGDNLQFPEPYRAIWHDVSGYFALITSSHCGGHYPVTVEKYTLASAAYEEYSLQHNAYLRASRNRESVAEDIAWATEHHDDAGLERLIDIALEFEKEMLLAIARRSRAEKAYLAASRDVETVEELNAREQAFQDELDHLEKAQQAKTGTKKSALNRTKQTQLRSFVHNSYQWRAQHGAGVMKLARPLLNRVFDSPGKPKL